MKKLCANCMKEEEFTVTKEVEEVNVKGDKFKIELVTPCCKVCGQEIFVKEIEQENDCLVYEEYRKRNHLLTTKDIKHIRDTLGLSQKAFAKILGFGEKTITRYENGSIQDFAHDNLMRLFAKKFNVRMILEIRKEKLTSKERNTLHFALEEKLDLSFVYEVQRNPFVLNQYDNDDKERFEGNNYEC